MKKILLLCPESHTVKSFRIELIKKFQIEGYRVGVCAFDDIHREDILSLDVDFFSVQARNRSLNPFELAKLSKYYKRLIKEYKPDIVFTFVLKPNIIGTHVAYKLGVKNIYSMVEGAGDVFNYNTLKWKLIRFLVCCLYKKSFKNVKKVFFLNQEDKAEFVTRKLVKEIQCEVINGIGINLQYFTFKAIKNYNKFLMIARMLETKGVYEYCQCARLVKQKYPEAQFAYLGAESGVKREDIQEYIDDGSINYLGTTDDVRPYIEDCAVNILPSYYREGLPLVNVEAGAIGRASITGNVIGAKNTVKNEYNGFLINPRNISEMVDKVCYFLDNPLAVEEMGKNARKFVEEKFDSIKINDQIIKTIYDSYSK